MTVRRVGLIEADGSAFFFPEDTPTRSVMWLRDPATGHLWCQHVAAIPARGFTEQDVWAAVVMGVDPPGASPSCRWVSFCWDPVTSCQACARFMDLGSIPI